MLENPELEPDPEHLLVQLAMLKFQADLPERPYVESTTIVSMPKSGEHNPPR